MKKFMYSYDFRNDHQKFIVNTSNSSDYPEVIDTDNLFKVNIHDVPIPSSIEKETNKGQKDDNNDCNHDNDSEEKMSDNSDNDRYNRYSRYNENSERNRDYYYCNKRYKRKTFPIISSIIFSVTTQKKN